MYLCQNRRHRADNVGAHNGNKQERRPTCRRTASFTVSTRYAEGYPDHVLHDGLEAQEVKVHHGLPSFSYLRMRIHRILNGDDR